MQVFHLRTHSVSPEYQAVIFAEYLVSVESRLLISATHSASAESKIFRFSRPLLHPRYAYCNAANVVCAFHQLGLDKPNALIMANVGADK